MKTKRKPVNIAANAAKYIAASHHQDQVIIFTWNKETDLCAFSSYGRTAKDEAQVAQMLKVMRDSL